MRSKTNIIILSVVPSTPHQQIQYLRCHLEPGTTWRLMVFSMFAFSKTFHVLFSKPVHVNMINILRAWEL